MVISNCYWVAHKKNPNRKRVGSYKTVERQKIPRQKIPRRFSVKRYRKKIHTASKDTASKLSYDRQANTYVKNGVNRINLFCLRLP